MAALSGNSLTLVLCLLDRGCQVGLVNSMQRLSALTWAVSQSQRCWPSAAGFTSEQHVSAVMWQLLEAVTIWWCCCPALSQADGALKSFLLHSSFLH